MTIMGNHVLDVREIVLPTPTYCALCDDLLSIIHKTQKLKSVKSYLHVIYITFEKIKEVTDVINSITQH